MGKIICSIICSLFLVQTNALAQTPYEYGDTLLKYSMNNSLTSSDFWYIYQGKDAASITTEKQYGGGKSLKIDAAEIKNNGTRFNFHTKKLQNKHGISGNTLYFELFIWGMDKVEGSFNFYPYFDYLDGTTKHFKTMINYDPPDQNGWVRVWAAIPADIYKNFSSCYMAVMYIPSDTEISFDYFYIDDISIRIIPDYLYIQNVAAKNSVDLNSIRVMGVNNAGQKKKITTSQFFKWYVVNGSATLEDGVLKPSVNFKNSEDIMVRCEFFGLTCDFNVNLTEERTIGYSAIENEEDGDYGLCAANNSFEPVTVLVQFALFNDEARLYSMQTVSEIIPPKSSINIMSGLHIPKKFLQPQIKIFCWNKFDGFYGTEILVK